MEVKYAAIYNFGKRKDETERLREQAIKYLTEDEDEKASEIINILKEGK